MQMLQQDTIAETSSLLAEPQEQVNATPRHPYQVLRLLPRDATPAQQDSAIQATFQPKQIRYSQQPDTLHIPGQEVGKSIRDVNVPKYYRESFFAKDSLLRSELKTAHYGEAGDPVPRTMGNDDVITAMLMSCLLLTMLAMAHSGRFFLQRLRNFFYISYNGVAEETSHETIVQVFLAMQDCLLLALSCYFYTNQFVGHTFVLDSPYWLVAIFCGMIAGYYGVKQLLGIIVNMTFFDSKKHWQYTENTLFLTAIEGVLLFPLLLLWNYFGMHLTGVPCYFASVVVLIKLLTFYKCHSIFFNGKSNIVQLILYFCTLEVIPLLTLWSLVVLTGNLLQVNY